jgi:hypothetical protein
MNKISRSSKLSSIGVPVVARYETGQYVDLRLENNRLISEHRYVMNNLFGRELFPSEIVHHVDGNKRNNDPSNLIIISQSEHASIHGLEKKAKTSTVTCAYCGKEYEITDRRLKQFKKNGYKNLYCSRSCVGRSVHEK